MLSILIPTYNYDASALLLELVKQISEIKEEIEVLLCDDYSERLLVDPTEFSAFPYIQFHRNASNLGRTATRQLLANKARYERLLFMDADVFPVRDDFLSVVMTEAYRSEVLFGGIAYTLEPPDAASILRWKYGHKREAISLDDRTKKPFSSINSGCFCIKRRLFLQLNQRMDRPNYGMDIYFKQLLRESRADVLHNDNPVYHLGLEDAQSFIDKSLQSVATTVSLEEQGLLEGDSRPLQKGYNNLKRLGLIGLFSWAMERLGPTLLSNFRSKRPNLFWFDLYRLNHYIELKRK